MSGLIIIVFALSVVVINIILGYQERQKTNLYRSLYVAEHTKSFFAKARNEMMRLAAENKIDTQSDFFKSMYSLHTLIMRNPDSYSDFSAGLAKAIFNIQKRNPKQLTESEKNISYMTAEAMGHIIINYSSAMRFLFGFAKRWTKNKINHASFIVFISHLGNLDKKIQAEREIKTAQEELYRLSSNSGMMPC